MFKIPLLIMLLKPIEAQPVVGPHNNVRRLDADIYQVDGQIVRTAGCTVTPVTLHGRLERDGWLAFLTEDDGVVQVETRCRLSKHDRMVLK